MERHHYHGTSNYRGYYMWRDAKGFWHVDHGKTAGVVDLWQFKTLELARDFVDSLIAAAQPS